MTLQGNVAIVTGSTEGIGRGIARRFAAEGAAVVAVGRDEENGNAVARELQGLEANAVYVRTDVSRAEDVEHMVQRTVEAFGLVDILVNNAGGSKIARGTPFFELALEDWQRQIGLNLHGTFYYARAAARNMIERQQGTIINIASVFSFVTGTGNAAYTAAKGGIVQLTKAMAVDLASYRVGVNAVAPGPSVFEKDYSIRDSVMGDYLLVERWGTVEDIAAAALFLASDESSYIDGQTITVDGGLLALMPGKPLGQP